jgi:hypothetical protein
MFIYIISILAILNNAVSQYVDCMNCLNIAGNYRIIGPFNQTLIEKYETCTGKTLEMYINTFEHEKENYLRNVYTLREPYYKIMYISSSTYVPGTNLERYIKVEFRDAIITPYNYMSIYNEVKTMIYYKFICASKRYGSSYMNYNMWNIQMTEYATPVIISFVERYDEEYVVNCSDGKSCILLDFIYYTPYDENYMNKCMDQIYQQSAPDNCPTTIKNILSNGLYNNICNYCYHE